MRNLVVIGMVFALTGCMMPVAKQRPLQNTHAKYKRINHKHTIQHTTNNSDASVQDGVPVVNLMAPQGGIHA